MGDETYNGWEGKGNKESAYATWRVCLELVEPDTIRDIFTERPSRRQLADWIQESVTEFVTQEDPDAVNVATQYALAFLEDVNWDEIAENVLSDWPEED